MKIEDLYDISYLVISWILFVFFEQFQEQRAHIQFLGTALNNAETNVGRLEEENKLKEGYADRVKQMTRSLDQLQKASEKREAMEKKLRAKLEEELRELREAQNGLLSDGNQRPAEELRSKLSEAEEKVRNFCASVYIRTPDQIKMRA